MGTLNIILLQINMLHRDRGRGLKQLLELMVVFSSLLQYFLEHHIALNIFVQLQETQKYPIYYQVSIFFCKYWLLLWWWFFSELRVLVLVLVHCIYTSMFCWYQQIVVAVIHSLKFICLMLWLTSQAQLVLFTTECAGFLQTYFDLHMSFCFKLLLSELCYLRIVYSLQLLFWTK